MYQQPRPVMAAKVGENGFHKIELTSESDEIQGDTLTVYYSNGDRVIEGASDIGAQKGGEMVFATDFEDKDITPGIWVWEVLRDAGGTIRQVAIKGERGNQGSVQVTNSEQI